MQCRTWVWDGSLIPKLKQVTLPDLGEHDVLVRVMSIGICATDLHIMRGHAQFYAPPYALGHEAAGEVVQVGSAVCRVRAGDRCTLDPSVGCGHCPACLTGNKHQCQRGYEHGINYPGFWQEYVVIHENNVYAFPEHVPYEEATQCETLHVCVGGIDLLQIRAGERVCVIGDGPTGLFFSRLSHLQGASQLTVIGSRNRRMQLAVDYGATDTVNYRTEDLVTEERRHRYDVVIEAVGKSETIQAAQTLIANQGRILLFGLPERRVELDVMDIILRELHLMGSANAPRVWPRVVDLIASKQVEVQPMITHRFRYEDLDQAIAYAFERDPENIKTVVCHDSLM